MLHPALYKHIRTAPDEALATVSEFMALMVEAVPSLPVVPAVADLVRAELAVRADERERRGLWASTLLGTSEGRVASVQPEPVVTPGLYEAWQAGEIMRHPVPSKPVESEAMAAAVVEAIGETVSRIADNLDRTVETLERIDQVLPDPPAPATDTLRCAECGAEFPHRRTGYSAPRLCPACRDAKSTANLPPLRSHETVLQPERPELICRTCGKPFRRQGYNTSGKSCGPCLEAAKTPKTPPAKCARCGGDLPQPERPKGGRAKVYCDPCCKTLKLGNNKRYRDKQKPAEPQPAAAPLRGRPKACQTPSKDTVSVACEECAAPFSFTKEHPSDYVPKFCEEHRGGSRRKGAGMRETLRLPCQIPGCEAIYEVVRTFATQYIPKTCEAHRGGALRQLKAAEARKAQAPADQPPEPVKPELPPCKVCGGPVERTSHRGKAPEKCQTCRQPGPTELTCATCQKPWLWDKPNPSAHAPLNCPPCVSKRYGRSDEEPIGTLIAHARNGDRKAWDALYGRYKEPLLASVRSFANVDLEAALQDVWTKAFESNLAAFNSGNLLAWLKRCLRNRCLDEQRLARKRDVPLESARETASRDNPEAAVIAADEAERALDEVAEVDREILLRKADGETQAEIAADLGLSPGTVAVRTHRARAKINEARPTKERVKEPGETDCISCKKPTKQQPCASCRIKGISGKSVAAGITAKEPDEPPYELVEVIGDGTGGLRAGHIYQVKKYAAAGWRNVADEAVEDLFGESGSSGEFADDAEEVTG